MKEVAIVGVGLCKFGVYPERSVRDMGEEAIWNALQHANVQPKDIQIAYCGTVGWDPSLGCSQHGQVMLDLVGITGIPITRVENMCCTGSCAFREAWIAVASGLYDISIAIGVEKMSPQQMGDVKGEKGITTLFQGNDMEGSMGLYPPNLFSMMANRYQERNGISREELRKYMALVSVKNRFNGSLNPNATFQKTVTMEDVLNSRMIADPIQLLDCCPEPDGCAVAILASEEVARKFTTKPVYVAATTQATGIRSEESALEYEEMNQRALKEAYEFSGIGAEDIDVVQVHDCFTISEILWCEALGFAKPGEYGKLLEEGETELGGKLPINTDGGLLAKGHPLGATGIGQIAEIVYQLRGEAGKRQVDGAKVGLCQNEGGLYRGTMGNTSIHILKK